MPIPASRPATGVVVGWIAGMEHKVDADRIPLVAALRRVLAEHDLSPVQYAHAARWEDVAALLDHFALPVVVKPTELSGSRGVLLLQHEDELTSWGAMLESYSYAGPVLVEEYLHGPEFSVETISVRGTHHVIGVTRKLLGAPPLFVEAGHVHPEPASPETDAIAQLVVDMLDVTSTLRGEADPERSANRGVSGPARRR